VVEGVARDFDLEDNTTAQVVAAPPPAAVTERFDLLEALKTLASLAERLREQEQETPKERKP
jgi:hypothetical protein